MGRSYTPYEYRVMKGLVADRDGGEFCSAGLFGRVDGEEECPHAAGSHRLQLDHVKKREECESEEEYLSVGNVRLLCASCNRKKEHVWRRARKDERVVARLGTGERDIDIDSAPVNKISETSFIRDRLVCEDGGTNFQANAWMEPRFELFVLTTVIEGQQKGVHYTRKELVGAGCRHAQCNPQTGDKYMLKICNRINGLLEEFEDGYLNRCVRVRLVITP